MPLVLFVDLEKFIFNAADGVFVQILRHRVHFGFVGLGHFAAHQIRFTQEEDKKNCRRRARERLALRVSSTSSVPLRPHPFPPCRMLSPA